MKTHFTPRFARAVAPLLCATAFIATPALAQDTQAAPPVVTTPPQSASVPPPPVVRTVPDTPPEAAAPAEPTAGPAPRAVTRPTATRTATRTQAPRPAPRAVAPAAPVPAAAAPTTPAEPAPAPKAAEPAAPAASTDAAPTTATPATDTASTTSSTSTGVPIWAWIGGGLAALAILLVGVFALRRRRVENEYYAEPYVEETYVEPVAVAPAIEPAPIVEPEPVAAIQPRKEPEFLRRAETPVAELEPIAAAADEVEVSNPDAAEVAELTAATPPVAERPWLEFAMRPVRAGTNVDEALVEIELTVGNSGSLPANDVRISTFLLSSDPNGSEMERLLVLPPADATTDPVTIQPGEGKRIDATLALLKSDMGEELPESFRPIVVADARYTLADGSEGRTSASFTIGVTPEEGEGLEPVGLTRASMHENVGAELLGEPQRA